MQLAWPDEQDGDDLVMHDEEEEARKDGEEAWTCGVEYTTVMED